MKPISVQVFAPATVGNMAVGFDILGFALESVGDLVTVAKIPERRVEISSISWVANQNGSIKEGDPIRGIPLDPHLNTAARPLLMMVDELGLQHGFRLEIKKGIPISAGMGGSAASAVGAVVGASALLNQPLDRWDILRFALHGEELTSGSSPHSDNIAPCLFGGIQLSYRDQWIGTVPFPQEVLCVLVHPNIKIETKMARDILEKSVPLGKHVSQMARLAGFLLGCTSGERGLIQNNLRDEIIEPQRQKLIPGFRSIQNAAFCLGAWGCSISGSGPSVFALVDDKVKAEEIRLEIITQFEIEGIEAESWISPISKEGARVLL